MVPRQISRRLWSLLTAAVLLAAMLAIAAGPSAQAQAPAWDGNFHPYAVGDVVSFNGSTYQCIQAHTSQPDWSPPATPALWKLTAGGPTATATRVGATNTPTRTPTGATPTPTRTATATTIPPTVPPPPPGSRLFAPYIDMSLGASGQLIQTVQQQAGIRSVTLAFLVAAGGGCGTGWGGLGGQLPVDNLPNGTSMQTVVRNLQAAGVQVIISFGGAAGQEPAAVCTSAASLQTLYQSVINRYGVRMLDFDIEGGSVGNVDFNTRRAQALRGLRAANPGIILSYTLPVLPTGLVSSGISLLNTTKANGFDPDIINVMAMDYGSAVDNGGQMGLNAQLAAQNTLRQVQAAGLTSRIGVTPMIGVNDVNTEIFQVADANMLLSFARSNNFVTRLSYWSLSRDNGGCPNSGFASPTCSGVSQGNFDFARIFNGFQ